VEIYEGFGKVNAVIKKSPPQEGEWFAMKGAFMVKDR
jgi:hypothetical protein